MSEKSSSEMAKTDPTCTLKPFARRSACFLAFSPALIRRSALMVSRSVLSNEVVIFSIFFSEKSFLAIISYFSKLCSLTHRSLIFFEESKN
jgi:hypothetical protein